MGVISGNWYCSVGSSKPYLSAHYLRYSAPISVSSASCPLRVSCLASSAVSAESPVTTKVGQKDYLHIDDLFRDVARVCLAIMSSLWLVFLLIRHAAGWC